MLDQAMNKRMRQVFERLLLECLTSFHEKDTPEKLESYAGCMVRWTSVGHIDVTAATFILLIYYLQNPKFNMISVDIKKAFLESKVSEKYFGLKFSLIMVTPL